MEELWLGTDADGAPVTLPASALVRHVMALGSSGSGKTVFCKTLIEAAVLVGIPAICVDPQGDLCSFAAGTLGDEELRERGVDPALAAALRERLEVVIYTPGAPRGVPLSADPIDPGLASMRGEARVAATSRAAAMVVGLLGFDLDGDDGAGLAAVIDHALAGLARPSLATLGAHLEAEGANDYAAYARYLDPKKIRLACQRLARLEVGARRLLFHDGVPIDVGAMLEASEGKVRVSVVYLNTLHTQEDKDFFVAAIAERLYAWMLAHPSPDPQAIFYIDEVAPFIPPVRKPACKEGLSLLFKQARKYGVGCVMATQNPGDVDYRAMAQFGTWALGRLTTRQDLKKVQPTVASLAPGDADAILERLPSLGPGEFTLICPDAFDAPLALKTRWLMTRHETWSEERIEQAMRDRREAPPPAPPQAEAETEAETEADAEAEAEPEAEAEAEAGPSTRTSTSTTTGTSTGTTVEDAVRAALLELPSASVRELATKLQRSESAVRRALGRLLAGDAIREYSADRGQRYWAPETGGRPDLGMPETLPVLVGHVTADDAASIARQLARTKVLGLLGEQERLDRVELQHRLLYRLAFEERVERPLLARLFGDAADHRVGFVYVHPHNLGVVVFDNERGLRFEDRPEIPASAIRDLDGVTEREARRPADIAFEEADWTKRQPVDRVRAVFRERFRASPGEVAPLFVPLFSLYFTSEAGARRKVQIDALIGQPVRWLPPS